MYFSLFLKIRENENLGLFDRNLCYKKVQTFLFNLLLFGCKDAFLAETLRCVYTCEHFLRRPVCKHDVCVISTGFANYLQSVFSTNTKDVCGSVGTVFIWIFVLFHVYRKIFLSRQQFSHNCRRSWFVIFPWFAGSSWKTKFFKHVRKHNVCERIRSFRSCTKRWSDKKSPTSQYIFDDFQKFALRIEFFIYFIRWLLGRSFYQVFVWFSTIILLVACPNTNMKKKFVQSLSNLENASERCLFFNKF